MDKISNIRVTIKFQAVDKIPADLVARIIFSVDSAIKDSEIADFETIKREVPQLPGELLKEIEDGLTENKFKGMYLEHVKNGSIIIEGWVLAIPTWILLNTIGETFKDAWKETGLNTKIKNILLSKQLTKMDELIRRINDRIKEDIPLEMEGVKLDIGKGKELGANTIYLVAEFVNTYSGTRGDLTFKNDDYEEPESIVADQ